MEGVQKAATVKARNSDIGQSAPFKESKCQSRAKDTAVADNAVVSDVRTLVCRCRSLLAIDIGFVLARVSLQGLEGPLFGPIQRTDTKDRDMCAAAEPGIRGDCSIGALEQLYVRVLVGLVGRLVI